MHLNDFTNLNFLLHFPHIVDIKSYITNKLAERLMEKKASTNMCTWDFCKYLWIKRYSLRYAFRAFLPVQQFCLQLLPIKINRCVWSQELQFYWISLFGFCEFCKLKCQGTNLCVVYWRNWQFFVAIFIIWFSFFKEIWLSLLNFCCKFHTHTHLSILIKRARQAANK